MKFEEEDAQGDQWGCIDDLMFKQKDEKRNSVYNLLWKYKGYNLKMSEPEFEKKSYNIHKRKILHARTSVDMDECW